MTVPDTNVQTESSKDVGHKTQDSHLLVAEHGLGFRVFD